jgi:hypothetical protein
LRRKRRGGKTEQRLDVFPTSDCHLVWSLYRLGLQ